MPSSQATASNPSQAAPGKGPGKGKPAPRTRSDPGLSTAGSHPEPAFTASSGLPQWLHGHGAHVDPYGGWWWYDGQQYYYTTPASNFIPQTPQETPAASARPQPKARADAPPAAPEGERQRTQAPGDEPPDGGGDDDDEDSYSYIYETEEDAEEPPAAPKATASKSQAKKEPRSPLPRRRKSKEQDEVSSVATADLKDMLAGKAKTIERNKPALSQVKLEEFHGNRSHYQDWKRVLQAQQALFNLKEEELAMIVFLSCHGEARMILSQMEIEDMSRPGGLGKILSLLEEAFGSRSDEKFEEKQEQYLSYRRAQGQSIASYIAGLKRLRAKYLKEDPGTTISDKAFSQRMLARASLTRRERMDVFFSSGGRYKAVDVERVLRFRCGQIHLDERKGGTGRDRDERRPPTTGAPATYFRRMHPRGDRRYSSSSKHGPRWQKRVYFNDEQEEWPGYEDDEELHPPTDDEDLEQEIHDGYHAESHYYDEEDWDDDDGWWNDSYWQSHARWYDEEDDEEYPQASMNDLSEAYAAGWTAKAQSAGLRKGRGYSKGGGKSSSSKGGGKKRPLDKRTVEDRKKYSTCSSCGQMGHWRGDAVCPKVQRGEDALREKVSEANVVTKSPTSPSPFTSPEPVRAKAKVVTTNKAPAPAAPKEEPKEEQPSMKTHEIKMNWALMNNTLGRRLSGYRSDPDPSDSSRAVSEDEDFHMLSSTASVAAEEPRRPKRSEFKLALSTILKALNYEESEADEKVRQRQNKSMKLSAQEMLAAMPHMSKEEKKELYRQLKAEQEDIAAGHMSKPVEAGRLRRADDRAGYSAGRASAPARASTDPPSAEAPPPPPPAEVPKVVRKKMLQEFRRELYNNALDKKGQCVPSQASDVPQGLQISCKHDFNSLRWGANQSAHWAHCKDCLLKRVLYYQNDHGALVTEVPEASGTYGDTGPLLEAGDAIVDTGCRTAVAGGQWHFQHQQRLTQLGLTWETVSQEEHFKFGAGPPVLSRRAFIYPVFTHGGRSWVRISEVGGAAEGCPGLIGPSEMARWLVELHFGTRSMRVMGSTRPMRLSNTRHPVLQLLETTNGLRLNIGDWYTGDCAEEIRKLRDDPAQMAFYEQGLANSPEASETTSDPEPLPEEENGAPELSMRARADLQQRLGHEVEASYGLLQDAFKERDTEKESSLGSVSEPASESSHEFGAPASEGSGSTSSDELDMRERHGEIYAAELQPFTKGQKRRVANAASQVLIGQDVEKQAAKERRMAAQIKAPRVPRGVKRLGLKIMELFTWSCLVSRIAYTQGWQFCEPITLPHWDITNPVDFEQALEYIDRESPDFLIVAWPCTKWSSYQRMYASTGAQRAALEEERREQRKTFLSLSGRAASLQRRKGKALLAENPATSLAWDQPEISLALQGLAKVQCDQCQYGLKHPQTGEPIKKRTQFVGQPQVVKHLAKQCPGDHAHAHIEGSVHVGDMSVSLATWCGAYPPALCRAMLQGATEFLQEPPPDPDDAYYEEVFAEEALMDGDEVIDQEQELDDNVQRQEEADRLRRDPSRVPTVRGYEPGGGEDRFPVAPEIRAAVEHAHRSLGHPSRATLVRMLRLAGALPGAIQHAQQWTCDVCQARAKPKQPTAAAPGSRPFGFNRLHQVDLKYCHDVRKKKYVYMSMIDCGTGYHQACLLKTRRSEYCATKWHKHWVSHYGTPQKIWHDQGGEFEKGFTALLEDLSVASTVTGSHAGWQLSFGERHGGILDLILGSVVTEHQVEGYSQLKLALSVAVQAKNSTITKDGYTPAQRVFGHELRFPDLLEQDQEALGFAEALGADGEVARAHKMRLTARMAMLRTDVQERLRRAVLRKPHRSHAEFVPGCKVYYCLPNKAGRRYVPGHWRGPATVLCKEGHNRFFVSWRGRCLLLARENMRLASGEELALSEPATEDLRELSRALHDPEGRRGFEDASLHQPPPQPRLTAGRLELRARGQNMLRGLRTAKQMMIQHPQPVRPRRKRKMIADQDQLALEAPEDARPAVRPRLPLPISGLRDQAAPAAPEVPAHEVPINDPDFDAEFGEELTERIQAIPGRGSQGARSQALEDVPFSLRKRPASAHQPNEPVPKRLRTALVYTLTATTIEKEKQNEWLSRYELALLRQLTGLEITAARMHYAPRKRLQPPPLSRKRARTSILIGRDPSMTMVVEENASEVRLKPKKKRPLSGRGSPCSTSRRGT